VTAADAATRYAGLAAIETGITAAKKEASEGLRLLAATSGLTKGEIATPFGPVTLAENKGSTAVVIDDETALVKWAQENYAEAVETVTRIRPVVRTAILDSRFVAVAGQVVDRFTGEVIPFARVSTVEAQPPTPSYRASDTQREAKRAAVEWARDRAESLVGAVGDMLAIDGGTDE
jgi:hypothetical protein